MQKILFVAAIALFASGCVQQSRQQHRFGRMMATSQAENADKKALEEVRADLATSEAEALELEESNVRAACLVRARAQHKACTDRNAVYSKSHSSMLKTLVDPNCDPVLETAVRTCERLPESK